MAKFAENFFQYSQDDLEQDRNMFGTDKAKDS